MQSETDPMSLQVSECKSCKEFNLILSWSIDYLASKGASQPSFFLTSLKVFCITDYKYSTKDLSEAGISFCVAAAEIVFYFKQLIFMQLVITQRNTFCIVETLMGGVDAVIPWDFNTLILIL